MYHFGFPILFNATYWPVISYLRICSHFVVIFWENEDSVDGDFFQITGIISDVENISSLHVPLTV